LCCCAAAVKFKLSKIPGSDDLLKGLHRLLFNRDGTVRGRHTHRHTQRDISRQMRQTPLLAYVDLH
jgi:hypothetical protein